MRGKGVKVRKKRWIKERKRRQRKKGERKPRIALPVFGVLTGSVGLFIVS